MSFSYLALGIAPKMEEIPELGKDPLYIEHAETHSQVFKRMLERLFPNSEKVTAMFLMKGVPTLQGIKRDVFLAYQPNDQDAAAYAKKVSDNLPVIWDNEAQYELDWYSKKAMLLSQLQLCELTVGEIPAEYQTILPPKYNEQRNTNVQPSPKLRMPTIRAASTIH